MRRARPEPGILAVLVATTGVVAVATALANAAVLVRAGDVARLRDLRLIARLRYTLDADAPALLAYLPTIVHAPFDLARTAGAGAFTALAIAVHLVVAWLGAAVIAPLALALARGGDARRSGVAWRDGYPFVVAAVALTPIVAHRLSLWTTASAFVDWAAGLALAAALAWIAHRLVGTRARTVALVRAFRYVTLGATALAIAGATFVTVRTDAGERDRPLPPAGTTNVLLISIDTLRPDHLGSYGYGRPTSPNLDALAAAGARFTTVVSPTSWTLPAHMTLLTGLPPEIHGVENDGLRLDARTVTLAEVLRARGYATAGVVSGPYLDAGYGFARGFDLYDDWSAVRISRPATHQAHTSPAVVAAVESWLDGRASTDARRPFFLFVHFWDVHYDFNPPAPYDTMFDPDYTGSVTGLDFETGDAVHAGMPARDLAHVVALYDGEIRYTDGYVGALIEALRARGILDDTLVVATADHGEEFFEHGNKGHRNALYDESIRVPLIIRRPGLVTPGTVVDRQVRLIDVPATILAMTDTPTPPSFGLPPSLAPYAGESLAPWLTSTPPSAPSPLPAFADLQPHAMSAVRHPDTKLIETPFAPTPEQRQQLFDLGTDPTEHTNLATQRPADLTNLHRELETWHDTAKTSAQQTQPAPMDADHNAALRALGYIK